MVVRLGETIAVAAPERALSPLRRLAGPKLLNVTLLLGALEPLRPTLFGVASLSFANHQTIAPVTAGSVRVATDADVEAVVSRCSTDERDESGLLYMDTRPGDGSGEDDGATVGDGVLVVAGGQTAPLLEQAEGAFDDVAPPIPVCVVGDRSATGRTATLAVALLVTRVPGDPRADTLA